MNFHLPLCVLCFCSGVNVMLRMIAVKAASKPLVEITQDGEMLSIKTSTSVRTTHITFTVGQEFNESTVDGRPCTVQNTKSKTASLYTQRVMWKCWRGCSDCIYLFNLAFDPIWTDSVTCPSLGLHRPMCYSIFLHTLHDLFQLPVYPFCPVSLPNFPCNSACFP